MTVVKLGLTAALAAALTALLVVQHGTLKKLGEENQSLQHQFAQCNDLRQENQRLSNRLAGTQMALPDEQRRELLRLRGEVAGLRRQKADLERAPAVTPMSRTVPTGEGSSHTATASQPLNIELRRESWTYAGYADPFSAFQSLAWASTTRDYKNIIAGFVPEAAAEAKTQAQQQRLVEIMDRNSRNTARFELLAQQAPADDEVVYTVKKTSTSGAEATFKMCFKRIGSEWKYNGEHPADWNP
jgi:hypothetical protein